MSPHFEAAPAATLAGEISVPGDKSISHRSLMLGGLADGVTEIEGLLLGTDVLATAAALAAMGVEVEGLHESRCRIRGAGVDGLRAPEGDLDMGNSGTGMRLLTGILAGQRFPSRLSGDESLSRRPMGRIIEPLTRMGADIRGDGGFPPLQVRPARNGLNGIAYESPLASAQVKSCVLLAGLFAAGETRLREPLPSRDHTERMLAAFGYPIEYEDGWWQLSGGQRLCAPTVPLRVPGDVSSAMFWLVAGSIIPGSDLRLPNVGMNPTRCGGLELLRRMGASIDVVAQRTVAGEPVADLRVRARPLQGIVIEPGDVPAAIDEFPALFVAAAFARGRTEIRGAGELRAKESDRIAVMAAALNLLGGQVEELPDGAVIHGGGLSVAAELDAAGDHRCAMALAVAGAAGAGCRIPDTANVQTSYPDFAAHAAQVGLDVGTVMA